MFKIHPSARIHPTARIAVDHGFIGADALVRENVIIEGRRVEIGREAFFGRGAWVGGGSSHDPEGLFVAGDFVHLGASAHVNIARAVRIGHEVGLGWETKIFTHGAYLPAWEGFPVQWAPVTLGDRVWLPNAWVNPGVSIGADVVVAAGSVVTQDLPSGCLAAGAPAAVKRTGVFPRQLTQDEKSALFGRIMTESCAIAGESHGWSAETPDRFRLDQGTVFDLGPRTIDGPADRFTETLKQQLRRNGIRFRYESVNGEYRPWSPDDPAPG